VSIVLCTRDRPSLLADALAALRVALPAEAEVIVVDSGSTTTETADVAAAAGVRYVRSDVPGLSIARNLGLRSSDRDIVVFTDDDCLVVPGFLDELVAPFESASVGATTGTLRDASDDRELAPGPLVALHAVTEGLDAGHGALMAFRRSAILDLGGFDPVLGAGRRFGGAEDMDAVCRILRAGLIVVRVPRAVVRHVFTRGDDDYLRLNTNYGLGMGAMCAKWLREAGGDGRRLTAVVIRRGLSRFARRLRPARARRGQGAYLRGLVRGYAEGRRLDVADLVFVDAAPPTPVPRPVAVAVAQTEAERPSSAMPIETDGGPAAERMPA
jgi:glycosyltransferase involved in cell wall biosynthesis